MHHGIVHKLKSIAFAMLYQNIIKLVVYSLHSCFESVLGSCFTCSPLLSCSGVGYPGWGAQKHLDQIKVCQDKQGLEYPSDKAIGTKNRACRLVSKIIGASPPNVVTVVKIIGLNRRIPACVTASKGLAPALRRLFA